MVVINRTTFLAAAFILVSALTGCMQQVKVTYIPRNVDISNETQDCINHIAISNMLIQEQQTIEPSCDDSLALSPGKQLKEYLKQWSGVQYRRGGTSPRGIDCSGLTQLTYRDLYGVELPRTVVEQSRKGVLVDKSALRPGDLVFFKTGIRSRHVGIYVGNNRFIHASRSKGVISSSLDNGYWHRKFWQAKRYPSTIRKDHEKILLKG